MDVGGRARGSPASESERFEWFDALDCIWQSNLKPGPRLVFVWLWRQAGGRAGYVERFTIAALAQFLGKVNKTVREPFDRLVEEGYVEVIAHDRGEYKLWITDPRERGIPRRAKLDPQRELLADLECDADGVNDDRQGAFGSESPLEPRATIAMAAHEGAFGSESPSLKSAPTDHGSAESLPTEGTRRNGFATRPGQGEGGAPDHSSGAPTLRLPRPQGAFGPESPLAPQEPRNQSLGVWSECLKTKNQEIKSLDFEARKARGDFDPKAPSTPNGTSEHVDVQTGVHKPEQQRLTEQLAALIAARQACEAKREERLTPRPLGERSGVLAQATAAPIEADSQAIRRWTREIAASVNRWASDSDPRTRYPETAACDVAMAIVLHALDAGEVRKVLAGIAALGAEGRLATAGGYADRAFSRLLARTSAPYRRRQPKAK